MAPYGQYLVKAVRIVAFHAVVAPVDDDTEAQTFVVVYDDLSVLAVYVFFRHG